MGYTYLNWAGNTFDHQSITEYYMFDGGNLVSWKSKKQHVVDHSITEEEYHVMASTLMKLFSDNQPTMYIASNSVFYERTKHIKFDCHYIHHQVQSKLIKTWYVCTHGQLANVLTKVLPFTQFHRLLSKLGSIDLV